jgi:regulatory protein
VLDQLQARGLLCDERFAAGFSRQRAARFGAARVGHDLRQRGLPEPLIRAALKSLQDSELARACALWQRRFARAPQSPADYARQARFLAGRGFPTDIIRQAIGCKDQDPGLE